MHTHTLDYVAITPTHSCSLWFSTPWLVGCARVHVQVCDCRSAPFLFGCPLSTTHPPTRPSTLWFCTLIAHYTPTEVENTDRSSWLEYYVHVHMHYSHGNSLIAYYGTVPVVSGNAQLQLITIVHVHYICNMHGIKVKTGRVTIVCWKSLPQLLGTVVWGGGAGV